MLSLFTGGAIGESMDEFDFMRFLFDTVYVVFMEIMFQSIVGGIMIDAFSELKDQDSARDEDKSSFCYICGMTKPDVRIMLFRWKKVEPPSRNISANISYGTICIISTFSKKKIKQITLVSNSISTKKLADRMWTGSQQWVKEMLREK